MEDRERAIKRKELVEKLRIAQDYRIQEINVLNKLESEIAEKKQEITWEVSIYSKGESVVLAAPLDDAFDTLYDDIVPSLDSDYEYSKKRIYQLEEDVVDNFYAYSTGSGQILTQTVADGFSGYINDQKEIGQTSGIQFIKWNEPSPVERKDVIASELEKIQPRIGKKLRDVWKLFLNNTLEWEIITSAHAMREMLSDLEHELAPDNAVGAMEWCEYSIDTKTKKGTITQKSRLRYMIYGSRLEFPNDDALDVILELIDNAAKLYNELSDLAHYREGTLPPDVKKLTEKYIERVQTVIEAILRQRQKYFK